MDDGYKVGNKPLKDAGVDRVDDSYKVGNKPLKNAEVDQVDCNNRGFWNVIKKLIKCLGR